MEKPDAIAVKNLRCPYCGSELYIETEWIGGFGNSEQVPAAIVCGGDAGRCDAEWETNGDLRIPGAA